jgi:adenylate cyclase class 2
VITSDLRLKILDQHVKDRGARQMDSASSLLCASPNWHMLRADYQGKEDPVPIEHEAKILDVDADALEKRILAEGGHKHGEALQRRYVYDITPGDASKWIRLRDTGREITLTIKEISHDGIDGTQETEVAVDGFEQTNAILEKLGYTPKAYQENKRVSFTLDGAEIEIDTWPHIPTYAEVEAAGKDDVLAIAARLGYTEDQLTGENTTKVYARYGIDLTSIIDLRFTPETDD